MANKSSFEVRNHQRNIGAFKSARQPVVQILRQAEDFTDAALKMIACNQEVFEYLVSP